MKKIFYIILGIFFSFFYGGSFAIIAPHFGRECEEDEIICTYTKTYNYDQILNLILITVFFIILILGTYYGIKFIKNLKNKYLIAIYSLLGLMYFLFISFMIFYYHFVIFATYDRPNIEFKELIINTHKGCKPKKGINCDIPIPERLLKPIIYFYPEKKEKIKVELNLNGKIIADYPKYDEKIKGWEIMAYPDSKIIDLRDNKEYSYIFWEGDFNKNVDWKFDKGYVVEGKKVREFLQNILPKMGLTPKEYNEFIVYWYPLMQENKYNLIYFAGEEYEKNAPLKITPKPDNILRIFMVYKSIDEHIKIEKPKIKKFNRTGFTVVEWGGTKINNFKNHRQCRGNLKRSINLY